MTTTQTSASSSRQLEAAAVQALYHEWKYWIEENLDPTEFNDEVAIAILHEQDIPACRLAVDLQMLVGQAYWMAKEGSNAVKH